MKTRKLTALVITLAMLALCACDAQPAEPTQTQTNVPETVETTAPTEQPTESEPATEAPATEPHIENTETIDLFETKMPDEPSIRVLGYYDSVETAFSSYESIYNYNEEEYLISSTSFTKAFYVPNVDDSGWLMESKLTGTNENGKYVYTMYVAQIYFKGTLYDVIDYRITARSGGGARWYDTFTFCDNILACTGADCILLFCDESFSVILNDDYTYDVQKKDKGLGYIKYDPNHYLVQSIWEWLEFNSSSDPSKDFAAEYGNITHESGGFRFEMEKQVTVEEHLALMLDRLYRETGCNSLSELIDLYQKGEL